MNRTRSPLAAPASSWFRALVSLALVAAVAAPVAADDYQVIELGDVAMPAAKAGPAVVEKAGAHSPAISIVRTAGDLAPDALAFTNEIEPNGTAATATPIAGNAVARGTVFPAADVDFYSFQAAAGDKVYAAIQSLFDASGSGNSTLELIAPDGTTVLETDLDDGSFGATSSSIAGTVLAGAGTHYLRVIHATGATLRPYFLHVRIQSGVSTPEIEPNNTTATATPLPANGWVSGSIVAVSPGESDFYSLTLAAGDTVHLSLDMNPERDAGVWNGRLGLGIFGSPPTGNNQILVVNDANAGATPNSEAFFFTVRNAGTYFVYVDSIVAAGLGPTATYELSATVRPAAPEVGTCTTYTSTNVPVAIPAGPGMVTSTLTVPGNPRIADIDVLVELDHTFMQDLDVNLVSPAGNDNGLFSDIGAATVGGPQTTMRMTFDDEAGLPPAFALSDAFVVQPELAYRLHWYDGEDAGGVWTLAIRDDAAGDAGNLTAWSLRICEPLPEPTCGPGTIPTTVYSSDFEADDGGFTHNGTLDEWERGLPTFVPITTCNSGTNCWKTDLDNTYDPLSSQNLLSPNINLAGLLPPVVVTWNQRYHVESATFDHYNVTVREVGNPTNAVNLFEFLDATMNNTIGNPAATVAESAGWGRFSRTIDSFAGLNTELVFHLDGDNTVQLAGAAVDDVSVTACMPGVPEITMSKTVGLTAGVCGVDETLTVEQGTPVTYCYTVENTGDITLDTHTLVDDQLGTILDNQPIALAPGDSVFVTVDDVILDATTTNNATWTASDSTGSSVESACGPGVVITGASGAPYPSTATFTGVGTSPSRVNVTLGLVSHTYASDMDFLVVGPGGQSFIVASDFSLADSISNVDLDLMDTAADLLPAEDPVASGSYLPTHYDNKIDDWPAPAPAPPYANPGPDGTDTLGAIFGGVDPNGTWSLYLTDAFPGADDGSIGGWCVEAVYDGPTATARDSVTVTLLFPDIAVDPASLESFLAVDSQETQPLDITNNGSATLDWTITESEFQSGGRQVLRGPGRQAPILPHRRNPAPEPGRVKAGSETFSRAEAKGEARRVAPEARMVPDGTVTITHSATQNIVALNSVSCNNGVGHTNNSYIRRFDLGAFGISGPFDIVEVSFGIEEALGAGGTQPLDVNLYTWNPADPFTFANFSPIGTASAAITDQSLTIVTVPVTATAPAGSTLVVEIFTPDGQASGNLIFVGSNPDGQTDPTFLAAADCGVAEPTDTAVLGFPGMHFVLNVTGEGGCDSDLPWVSVTPTSGATAPAATDTVDVTFDSTGLTLGGIYTGALCIESDDPDTPTVQVPLTLEVDSMPFIDGFETGDTTRWTFDVL